MTESHPNPYGNDHGPDTPASFMNRLDAEMEAVEGRHCEFCRPKVEVIPASRGRWILGITHQAECPQNPDNMP